MQTLIKPKIFITIIILLVDAGCHFDIFDNCKGDEIPVVTTDSIINLNPTYAQCVFNSNFIGWYNGICWSNMNENPTSDNSSFNCNFDVYLTAYQGFITDLTPGTTYYARAFSASCAGVGYGKIIKFTTPGNVTGKIHFNTSIQYDSINDIEGNKYKTVKIGNQIWMAENLKTTKFNDGTQILSEINPSLYLTGKTPNYSWYLNDSTKYKNAYGALYNWYSVNTNKLCPKGWHVADSSEWAVLLSYIHTIDKQRDNLKESDYSHWVEPYFNPELSSNAYGFTALPAGFRWKNEYFKELAYSAYFWISSEYKNELYKPEFPSARAKVIQYASSITTDIISNKNEGYSVRCIQDH